MSDKDHSFRVRFSDEAIDSMLMAATEAYVLGDGRRLGTPVEIDGYLWGFYVDLDDDETLIQVERFASSFSSKRTPVSVEPNEDAATLLHDIMMHLCPQLSFLGEVHTHPYSSLDEARDARGWRFSDEDLESMSDAVWDLTGDHPPLWIVIAIAPLRRVHSTLPMESDDSGAWRFDVGNMRFWVHTEVVTDWKDDGVRFAKNTILDMVPRLFNPSGNRLVEGLGDLD